MLSTEFVDTISACSLGLPHGYTPAASGANKAYRLYTQKVSFDDAKLTCEEDGAEIAMPRNVDDIRDIKDFDCEYSLFTSIAPPETYKNELFVLTSIVTKLYTNIAHFARN